MLVFSYRDEEAAAVQSLLHFYAGARVTDIPLSNLDLSGVSQTVAYQMGSTDSDTDDFSELTLQRTGGNPFIVSLFLEISERENSITMDGTTPIFHVDKMAAESIADCLLE